MRVRRTGGGGFTLVELMVAAAVLAVGLSAAVAAVIAATRVDRRNNSAAAAHAVATELARLIETWDFADPRLAYVNHHTGPDFAGPTVVSFTLEPGNPVVVREILSAAPDHQEGECGFCGRDLTRANAEEPGSTFLFARYWNVMPDPANPHLKLVAVHVTYARSASERGVATVVTAISNREALSESLLRDQF